MKNDAKNTLEALSSLCKRRGFIFQSSELYGGINGFWDYGPLGSELKRNVRDAWWRSTVTAREDVVGLDAAIIMHPRVWEASGHVAGFADPMVDCKQCRKRFKGDNLCEEQGKALVRTGKGFALPEGVVCPGCGSKDLTEPRAFNLMFKTFVGPVEDDSAVAYLRPETAQGIFVQFGNVLATSRQAVPFGIAQIGKAFRNEINPRNYTFRSREFEQMELEFFIRPDEAIELLYGKVTTLAESPDLSEPQPAWGWQVWHKYWVEERLKWYRAVGLPASSLVEYWQKPDELAHYARACVDIQFAFPFGTQELEGIAARSDFDLMQHQQFSGKPQDVFDEELKNAAAKLDAAQKDAFIAKVVAEWAARGKPGDLALKFCNLLFEGRYVPHVIEPSAGVDRIALALLCNAYAEEWVPKGESATGVIPAEAGKQPPQGYEARTVMRFAPRIAPVRIGVFPLVKNKPELLAKARAVFETLRYDWNCFWDQTGAIGRRYRRQDEVGTPFCVTVDFDTLANDTVTVRQRDAMSQERVAVADLPAFFRQAMR